MKFKAVVKATILNNFLMMDFVRHCDLTQRYKNITIEYMFDIPQTCIDHFKMEVLLPEPKAPDFEQSPIHC